MKTKLKELTIGQFIDLLCGNIDVLACKKTATPEEIAITIRNIVLEYREIADDSGLKSYLAEIEELAKARISVSVFSICDNLMTLNEVGRVREILDACGVKNSRMSDQRVRAEVKSRLARAKDAILRIEPMPVNDKQIDVRGQFDSQTATMMAFFKFQIDTDTMKAPIYAHLVARYNKEVKAQIAATRKR